MSDRSWGIILLTIYGFPEMAGNHNKWRCSRHEVYFRCKKWQHTRRSIRLYIHIYSRNRYYSFLRSRLKWNDSDKHEVLFDNVELGIDLVAVVQPLPLYRYVIYAMPTSSHIALKSAKYIEDSDEELEMAEESPSSSDLDPQKFRWSTVVRARKQ